MAESSNREDLALVARLLAGEEEAFDEFAERYVPALYRFALARLDGDRELTRDTVQTTMTKMLANLDAFRGEASLFTWLAAGCRNEILMLFRRRRSLPDEVELGDDPRPAAGWLPVRPPDPAARLARRETAASVHAVLDLLPPRYASALEWKYVERVPVKEIARRLEIGPKAAESLLTRARDAFRSRYTDALEASGAPPATAPAALLGGED